MIALCVAWLPAIAFALNPNIHYSVDGTMGHMGSPAKAYLEYFKNGNVFLDSCYIRDGKFSFSGDVEGPVQSAQLIIDPKGDGYLLQTKLFGFHAILFFLEKGKIRIVSPDGPDNAVLSGTPTNDEYNRFNKTKTVAELDRNINLYWDKWAATAGEASDTAVSRQAGRRFSEYFHQKHAIERGYLKTHPDSYISVLFLEISLPGIFDADTVGPLFDRLSARVRHSPEAVEIAGKLEASRSVAVGSMAPDFTENDTAGKAVKLSSFRGKYVLLDFWASWCGPCRAEMPNVIRVFNRYKDKNFTILSVSLDSEKDKWLEAIHHDGMIWTHVSALQFWKEPVAKKYNVAAVPQNVLIDPDGKIVGRNLMGEELDKKLGEVLSN